MTEFVPTWDRPMGVDSHGQIVEASYDWLLARYGPPVDAALVDAVRSALIESVRLRVNSEWLTRKEAADFCRVSLVTFDVRVASRLTPARIGGRVLFNRRDINEWLGTQKAGDSAKKRVAKRTSYASASPVSVSSDPRALEIRTRLRRPRSASTPTQSSEPRKN